MDWLILVLGVPAILIPLVLLFGFAGCAPSPGVTGVCNDDDDCPDAMVCVDGSCVAPGEAPPWLFLFPRRIWSRERSMIIRWP